MSEDHTANILEKVRALLAKGASTHSEEEAENCARLAQRLLEKHNLSMSDLPGEEKEEAGQQNLDAKYVQPWRSGIVQASCKLYFCTFFHSDWFDAKAHAAALAKWQPGYDAAEGPDAARLWRERPKWDSYWRPRFCVVGRPHNRAVAIEMIPYLWRAVELLRIDYARTLDDSDLGGLTRRAAGLAFERGCGERVASRLYSMAYAAKLRQRKDLPKGTALTLYDNFDAENEAFKKTLDLTKRRSGTSNTDGDHSAAGWDKGADVSLAPQITKDAPSRAHALPAPTKMLKSDAP